MSKGLINTLRTALRLRLKRQKFIVRALWKRRELQAVVDRTAQIKRDEILVFGTIRNEIGRLPHFLSYYRALGIRHFLFVDNGSDDGSRVYLADQPDVSLWTTSASYKRSRFGVDWVMRLLWKYGHGHWTLTLDADELLVFPHNESRSLRDLTNHLESTARRSFGAVMIDLYPKGPVSDQTFQSGDDPLSILKWYDGDNIRYQKQMPMENYWIQGGVRERVFFADEPRRSPTLNKIPLVKWSRRFAFVNSTHSMLPKRLNRVYDHNGNTPPSGALLHTKFLPEITRKSVEEKHRKEHFANSMLYERYYDALAENPDLWCETSVKYEGWEQLENRGLLSRGDWD
ncbi:glycosyltransferase family 2 protein [Halocynthiibacter sp. C4]|uniref:glycosyltransferase family 2 protein n=1 Tax=Halocynthiibacter sp. C4 TaxID=2992758 RepID=UPI00237B2281|nr:glycosyltransferase family 2 protein [Halocynthiibacter sp. C4]MDE0590941.1 glycosyltransferase family 2 protein [Halocynthiibacter sp. C4]